MVYPFLAYVNIVEFQFYVESEKGGRAPKHILRVEKNSNRNNELKAQAASTLDHPLKF